jgi:hypothetical protein
MVGISAISRQEIRRVFGNTLTRFQAYMIYIIYDMMEVITDTSFAIR